MIDLMIDLETMGNKPGAPIIAIGAVFFNPKTGEMGREFYREINLQSCIDVGCKMDASTVLWWLKQSNDARKKFEKNDVAAPIGSVLIDFFLFAGQECKPWGNGASFDLGILSHCYELTRLEKPWQFWNERDVRTIVDLDIDNYKSTITFDGIPHFALDDAKHQVRYVSKIIGSLTDK